MPLSVLYGGRGIPGGAAGLVAHRQADQRRQAVEVVGQHHADRRFGQVGHRLHDGGADVVLVAEHPHPVKADDLHILRHAQPQGPHHLDGLPGHQVGAAEQPVQGGVGFQNVVAQEHLKGGKRCVVLQVAHFKGQAGLHAAADKAVLAFAGLVGQGGTGAQAGHPLAAQLGQFLGGQLAAASEARMAGCDMPVIINSGSGNQGIASSVPVIVYAREKFLPAEKLYRALAFSGLLTVHQKEYIGKLSAFCGAVSASCAAGAAITYLDGGTLDQIKATIDNTLANIPGIICDGAKASCAAKIATSLDAAMLAHNLAMADRSYGAHNGILREDADETISCVGHIGRNGMRETDREIIRLMLQ